MFFIELPRINRIKSTTQQEINNKANEKEQEQEQEEEINAHNYEGGEKEQGQQGEKEQDECNSLRNGGEYFCNLMQSQILARQKQELFEQDAERLDFLARQEVNKLEKLFWPLAMLCEQYQQKMKKKATWSWFCMMEIVQHFLPTNSSVLQTNHQFLLEMDYKEIDMESNTRERERERETSCCNVLYHYSSECCPFVMFAQEKRVERQGKVAKHVAWCCENFERVLLVKPSASNCFSSDFYVLCLGKRQGQQGQQGESGGENGGEKGENGKVDVELSLELLTKMNDFQVLLYQHRLSLLSQIDQFQQQTVAKRNILASNLTKQHYTAATAWLTERRILSK